MLLLFQLKSLISSEELNISSEEQVYQSVMKWIKHDLPAREGCCDEVSFGSNEKQEKSDENFKCSHLLWSLWQSGLTITSNFSMIGHTCMHFSCSRFLT